MELDLIITGGQVVTAEDVYQTDIGIKGGKIAALGEGLQGADSFSAEGMLVLPGGIDAHVHLEMPTGTTRTSDDWYGGTKAAICGGTTTVIDFVEPEPGQLLLDALEARQAQARGCSFVDYSLHMTLTNAETETLAQIPAVVRAGVPSFKTYTTFDGFGLGDVDLLRVFNAIHESGGLVLVHSENDAIVQHCTAGLKERGLMAPCYYPQSRPSEAEIEAIQRVIMLARVTGVPLYIVHVSTAEGARAVERARQSGQTVIGETCPHYLLLDDGCYQHPDPVNVVKYICTPPIRSNQDQQALWELLNSGGLSTVCTDHCAFNLKGQKEMGLDSFLAVPAGLPGVESRLSLLYTCGVKAGRISTQQWVACCSTEQAKTFGLFPRKGQIALGSDADLVVFDPQREVVLSRDGDGRPGKLHEAVDYTPYEGVRLQGWPAATFLRGALVVQNQHIIETKPTGTFVCREGIQLTGGDGL